MPSSFAGSFFAISNLKTKSSREVFAMKLPITKSGIFIKYSDLAKVSSADPGVLAKKISNQFRLQWTNPVNPQQISRISCATLQKRRKRVIIPRFGFEKICEKFGFMDEFETESELEPGDDIDVTWCGQSTPNQKLILDHMMEEIYTNRNIRQGQAGCILNLEAGQGKSYIAANLIGKFQVKTAIIMHSKSILEQWVHVLKTCFQDSIEIGFYYGEKKKDGDVMLIIVNSAGKDEFLVGGEKMTPIEFFNQFGFIIYDECHLYVNKTGKKVMQRASAPRMLGLSATPEHHQKGFDPVAWWNIGPILDAAEIDGYEGNDIEFTAVVHRMRYYGSEEFTRHLVTSQGMVNVAGTVNMLCEDDRRNKLIVRCVKRCFRKGLNTFVFADRREYLLKLRDLISEKLQENVEVMTKDEEFMRIVGGAKMDDLKLAEERGRVILTTYQYMGTGKSITKMNGLVMATPRKNGMEQFVGRIFRLGSDHTIRRKIFDIVDMKVSLSRQWGTRKKYYVGKGFEIREELVGPTAPKKKK
jgi:hypothetical protein